MIKKYFKKINKLDLGFTLVETLIAISIFSVSIIALMSILGGGISNANSAKTKIIASYLAQEGIEYIRNMRETYVLYPINGTWDSFRTEISSCTSANSCGFDNSVFPPDVFLCSSHTNQCKLYVNNGNYNSNSIGVNSGFVRKIQAIAVNSNEVKISSVVSWTQGSGSYNVTLSENLFNWME